MQGAGSELTCACALVRLLQPKNSGHGFQLTEPNTLKATALDQPSELSRFQL